MNAFRVTLLVLFCLTVGLLFYAVTVLIPARQEQYELYRTNLKINEYQQRNSEHAARMAQLNPEVEAPEVSTARSEAEEAENRRRQELTEAEESSVLASAKRKEEERQAKESNSEVTAPAALGHVASYNSEWNSILFTPETDTPLNDGLVIAVRRGDFVVCEAVIDGRDEESGQVSATVKQAVFGASGSTPENLPTPQAGDEVIPTPFLSGSELRREQADFGAVPAATEEGGSAPQVSGEAPAGALPEVEGGLVPLP
ncbi:MAG: hypothetical protein ACI4O9_07225 [Akkermansia sp.]